MRWSKVLNMKFLTYLMTNSESPNTSILLTFKSISFLSPWIRASYLESLFVHSNSKWHAIIILFPCGSMRRQPSLTPYFFLKPSKYRVQMFGCVNSNQCTQIPNHNLWTLYFDISRNTQGVDVGYLFIDPHRMMTACHLEKSMEVFGHSWLVIKSGEKFHV